MVVNVFDTHKKVFCVILISLLACFPALAASDVPVHTNSRTAGPVAGDLCPLFDVTDSLGQRYSLDQSLRTGKTTVLVFWALRCAPCLREMAYIDEVYKKYKEMGLLVLGIEANRNTYKEIAEILEKLESINLDPSFPIIADPDLRLSEVFGINAVPQTFLVNRDGVVFYHTDSFSGEIKQEMNARIIETLMPVTPVKEPVKVPAIVPSLPVPPTPVEAPTIQEEEAARKSSVNSRLKDEFEKNRYFGDFYYHRKEYERAISCYEKCILMDKKNIYIHLKMGECYAEMKDFTRAREVWEKILQIDPGNREADSNIRKMIRGDF